MLLVHLSSPTKLDTLEANSVICDTNVGQIEILDEHMDFCGLIMNDGFVIVKTPSEKKIYSCASGGVVRVERGVCYLMAVDFINQG